ncbi:MAG: hypothetical protein ACK5L5_07555 [Bacteroidales bacterium]
MHKKRFVLLYLVSLWFVMACDNTPIISNDYINVEFNGKGQLIKLEDKKTKVDYLFEDSPSYFVQVELNDNIYHPESLFVQGNNIKVVFSEIDATFTIEYQLKDFYIAFELLDLECPHDIDKVVWGAYKVKLTDKVGQSLGVAYNNDFAIGLMGLNLKSCGGFELIPRERFGNTAQRMGNYTSLQGFTRSRSKVVEHNSCLQEKIQTVPVLDSDSTLIGSRFALYGVQVSELRNVISDIEKNEGLPHLTHDGEWLKNSQYATSSKFIMNYNVSNIDACLDVAEKAGITCVYHPGIFESWGTYPVNKKAFPDGYTSVLECSQKARKRNITLGAHALSNFITTDDPLVSPVPNSHLQLAGMTSLAQDLSADATEIELADESVRIAFDKDIFDKTEETKRANENKNREVFAVRIGNEIIEFSSVSKEGVLVLQGCKRGAFGTMAKPHYKGDKVGRLVSHYYKVFFPDIQLQDEVAKNLAKFFNDTKLERISFDGIEGGLATGHGRYACDRFIKVFYDNVDDKNIIANSSDVMHYSWHYFANESWGEPWWAKNFRESQLDHRLKVQRALEEDLLPRKMGQFSIDDKTTLKDIQWVMGLCAGYDAGVDFYISPKAVENNSEGQQILEEIRKWENIRWAQTLTDKDKELLRDPFSFYELKVSDGRPELIFVESWAPKTGKIQESEDRNTLPTNVFKAEDGALISLDYKHVNVQKEPGQPTVAEWSYFCKGKTQTLQFAIRLPKQSKKSVSGIYLKKGTDECRLPFSLMPGQYLVADASGLVKLYDRDGNLTDSKSMKTIKVEQGQNAILFDYEGDGRDAGAQLIVNFRTYK